MRGISRNVSRQQTVNNMDNNDDPSPERMIPRFEAAAGKAAVTELKLRILAEVIPALEQYAHGDKLHELEARIFDWFVGIGDPVASVDQDAIKMTRALRNKLLHGELHTARARMHQLGAPQQTGGVLHMKFSDAGHKLAQIQAALQAGSMRPVAAMATEDAGIAGWLMEMGVAGDFESACILCEQASALIDKLIDRANAYHVQTRGQRQL